MRAVTPSRSIKSCLCERLPSTLVVADDTSKIETHSEITGAGCIVSKARAEDRQTQFAGRVVRRNHPGPLTQEPSRLLRSDRVCRPLRTSRPMPSDGEIAQLRPAEGAELHWETPYDCNDFADKMKHRIPPRHRPLAPSRYVKSRAVRRLATRRLLLDRPRV